MMPFFRGTNVTYKEEGKRMSHLMGDLFDVACPFDAFYGAAFSTLRYLESENDD